MKKIISLILAVMLLAALASAAFSESQGTTMYVCTKNGKPLNVRSSMSTDDDSNIIGSLKYGTMVITYGTQNGWAMIDYGNTTGYIVYRYLSKENPGTYKASDSSSAQKTTQKTTESSSTKDASTVTQMNKLVDSAKFVTPYTVTVRPARASGWVYMRWFPSKSAETMATFRANYELTVIAELTDWYQVSDPESGKVGFVYKSYVQ